MTAFKTGSFSRRTGLHQVFDKKALEDLYGNDFGHFFQLLEIFNRTVPGDLDELDRAIKAKSYAEARRIAHRMKPKFSMIGLPHYRKAAQEFENILGRPTRHSQLHRRFLAFHQLITQVLIRTKQQEKLLSRRRRG